MVETCLSTGGDRRATCLEESCPSTLHRENSFFEIAKQNVVGCCCAIHGEGLAETLGK